MKTAIDKYGIVRDDRGRVIGYPTGKENIYCLPPEIVKAIKENELKGVKTMTEIEFIEDSNWQAHVTADSDDDYEPIVGSSGFIFNPTEGCYSTPVLDTASARSCYENLRNFFNRQD